MALTAEYSGDELRLSFPALRGETYRVEYCPDLVRPHWQLLREITMTLTNVVTVSDPVPAKGSARFYRVSWIR